MCGKHNYFIFIVKDDERDENGASGAEDSELQFQADVIDETEDIEDNNEGMFADLVEDDQMPVDLSDLEFHVEDELGIDEVFLIDQFIFH